MIQFLKIFLLLALQLTLVFSVKAAARGNEGGRGGDPYASEFSSLATAILEELEKPEHKRLLLASQIDLVKLKTAIKTTLVYSAEPTEVRVKDTIVAALNFLGGPIIINRADWREMFVVKKLKIVLHEYLGTLDVEIDTYPIVNKVEQVLNKLAENLIATKSLSIRYYGTSMASPSLQNATALCGVDEPWLAPNLNVAAASAKGRCQAERNNNCEARGFISREIISPSLPGIKLCEITALTQ